MTVLAELFGEPQHMIAMAHFPPMLVQPPHDASGDTPVGRVRIHREVGQLRSRYR